MPWGAGSTSGARSPPRVGKTTVVSMRGRCAAPSEEFPSAQYFPVINGNDIPVITRPSARTSMNVEVSESCARRYSSLGSRFAIFHPAIPRAPCRGRAAEPYVSRRRRDEVPSANPARDMLTTISYTPTGNSSRLSVRVCADVFCARPAAPVAGSGRTAHEYCTAPPSAEKPVSCSRR